jgi:hypothetical protein
MTRLLAALLIASRPEFCWFSDGWRGSGYYNCEHGPWVKEYDQQHMPRRRDYKHERERDQASSLWSTRTLHARVVPELRPRQS